MRAFGLLDMDPNQRNWLGDEDGPWLFASKEEADRAADALAPRIEWPRERIKSHEWEKGGNLRRLGEEIPIKPPPDVLCADCGEQYAAHVRPPGPDDCAWNPDTPPNRDDREPPEPDYGGGGVSPSYLSSMRDAGRITGCY